MKEIEMFTDTLRRLKYSQNTIKTYTACFSKYIQYFKDAKCDLRYISEDSIKNYLLYLVDEHHVSTSLLNQVINAIKFYYEKVLNQPRKVYYIDRPRQERKLPEILSVEEVLAIYNVITNLKHRSIFAILYGSGLRRSEVINLKIKDIDSKRMVIIVKAAKGNKDRFTQLSENTLEILREYYKQFKPVNYLFYSQNNREQYSAQSIEQFIKSYAQKAGITKNVHPHTLRHSYATHMIESGVSTAVLSNLLGHNSPKTTMIYYHVSTKHLSELSNPFDRMQKAV